MPPAFMSLPLHMAGHFPGPIPRRLQKLTVDYFHELQVLGAFSARLVVKEIGPWKSVRDVEWETLKWVDWYNSRRLLGPIGYIPPAEAEEAFYANLKSLDMVA
jgi:hypothetical protein